MIEVNVIRSNDHFEFDVRVEENSSETQHRVTMTRSDYRKLTGGRVTPAQCIEAAFKFLLDREPKESILSRFDVTVISRYFPNFREELPKYIQS
jgi:hypothetical protein